MKQSITFGFVTLVILIGSESEAGWFKKATGIRTPEPIRKIAPNGVSMPNLIRRPPETSSVLGVEPYRVVTLQLTNQTGAPIVVSATAYQPQGPSVNLPQRTLQPNETTAWSVPNASSLSRVDVTAFRPGTSIELRSWRGLSLSQRTQHEPSAGASPGGTATVYSGILTGTVSASRAMSISGTYNSNFGQVTISQNGNQFTGTVYYRSGSTGTFSGQVNDSIASFQWRNNGTGETGVGTFNIAGNVLNGSFRGNHGNSGTWNLYR